MRYNAVAGILFTLLAAPAAADVKVADDCADCHDVAPVSSAHEKVESLSVNACIDCHEAKPGDPFVIAVHTKHLDEGFECADCHGDSAPPKADLDRLLERPAP